MTIALRRGVPLIKHVMTVNDAELLMLTTRVGIRGITLLFEQPFLSNSLIIAKVNVETQTKHRMTTEASQLAE
jgi:hypothetical protein